MVGPKLDEIYITYSRGGTTMEECLKRKLVFGDVEQINAIKKIKKMYEELEEILGRKVDGPLKRYYASVTYTRSDSFLVDAPDKETAEIIADFKSEDYDEFDDKEISVYLKK